MRPIPVMLALLLALSPGAVALQASAPTAAVPVDQSETIRPSTDGNTTAVLTLGTDSVRSAIVRPSLSLSSTLSMDRTEFQTELSVATLDRQLRAANTVEQKKQILNRYRFRVGNRIISLKAKERQVTQAFTNGTISEREYLHALGRIDAAAGQLRRVINAMTAHANEVPRFNFRSEGPSLKGKLTTLEGPVRDRASRTLRGDASLTQIYVATADTGVVLSTIVGNTYVREITRTDRRNPGATGQQLSLYETQTLVVENYPWAGENSRGTSTQRFGTTNVYQMSINHPHGKLTVFLDGGTKSIFEEIQRKRLTGSKSLPLGPGVTNTSENVTVAVNRTYPGGPLRVKLTNSTGAPVDGRITVAGEPVGRTHGNGVVWTLGPAEQFRVSATYDDTTVNVTATPVKNES